LNSWLRDNGYLSAHSSTEPEEGAVFANFDWPNTRAYGLGLNGLYVNLKGREAVGTVAPGDRDALLAEISAKLLALIDPATGAPAVTRVFRREEVYTLAGHEDIAPDLIIGYAKGTRGSDQSALGGLPAEVIVDNTDPWNGDHCMDPAAVPGILLTNRRLRTVPPSLQALPAAILLEFGIENFPTPQEE
jgi:predicted AlkP superfamily phosphohydrolase/phosphomutase